MYIFVIIIVLSFLIFTKRYAKNAYKSGAYVLCDVLWRISIVAGVVAFTQYSIFSLKEGFLIGISLTCVYIISHFLSNFHRVKILAYFRFVSIVGAPIVEEIVFRGWLLNEIHGSQFKKVLIVSIIFGIYHIKNYYIKSRGSLIYQIVYASLVAGPIFGYAALQTGSLLLPIMLHAINNSLAITLSPVFVGYLKKKLKLSKKSRLI